MKKTKDAVFSFYMQFYGYFAYMLKHPAADLGILAGVLLSYHSIAFPTGYYVDSEVVINIPGTSYNWLEIGRYGLVFVKKLLGTTWYNPYYAGILLLLFLWLSGMSLMYVMDRLFPKLPKAALCLGSIIFLTYPTFTEQYYFHFQSAEVAFGLWLSFLAMGMFALFVQKGMVSCFVVTIPVYVLTFAIYQSFIPLALCGYLMIFLAMAPAQASKQGFYMRAIGGSILHFLCSFLISQGIHKLFFASSGYLTEQVIWSGGESVLSTLTSILVACGKMFLGYGLFYTCILWFAVIAGGFALWYYRKECTTGVWVLCLFAISGILLTPFLLTLLLGASTAARTQFVYPLAALALINFGLRALILARPDYKAVKVFGTVLVALLAAGQIATVNYIWHIHSEISDYDRETSMTLMEIFYDSFTLNDKGSPVLWGSLQPQTAYDDLIVKSPSYLFLSVYNLEHATEPYCYFSTIRVLGYMESMGHKFTLPTHKNLSLSAYLMNRESLPAFPDPGCVFNDSGVLTVNLGNCPEYYYK